MEDHELRVQRLGRRIAEASAPPRFRPRSLDDRLMGWVVERPGLRTPLFRLVDVFPACRDDAEVTRHVQEYLTAAPLPPGGRTVLRLGARLPGVTAAVTRRSVRRLARRFIGGENPGEIVTLAARLWEEGAATTVDLLGEKTVTAAEADAYAARVAELLETLVAAAPDWPPRPLLARDRWGPVPRVNVSVKPTALCPRFDPLEAEVAVADAARRLIPLVRRAVECGATIHLDVEHDEAREVTYALLRTVGEAVPQAHLGCVVQAYRPDAAETLESLLTWATSRLEQPLQVRLVKGAYWDTETVLAAAHGWPAPVFLDKDETDESFARCARYLIRHAGPVRPVIASHNLRSLADALATAEEAGLAPTDLELQLLHGMAPGLGPGLVHLGYRTRRYVPMGELEAGMAYLVRRLLENTSNESFVRRRDVDRADVDDLLRPPGPPAVAPGSVAVAPAGPGFHNEPVAELRRAAPRQVLTRAVAVVRSRLGFEAPVIIGGVADPLTEPLLSVDPADPAIVVCPRRSGHG